MIDNDAWYFTLSAIPQTLAAVITLSAMFVVFKLETVTDRIESELAILKRFLMPLRPEIEIHQLEKFSAKDALVHLEDGLAELKKDDIAKMNNKYEQLVAVLTGLRDQMGHTYDTNQARVDMYLDQKRQFLRTLISKRLTTLGLLQKSIIASVVPLAVSLLIMPHRDAFASIGQPIVSVMSLLAAGGVCFTAYSVWRISKL